MADIYKKLNLGAGTNETFSASAGTTIYTVPASTTTLVKKIVVSNNGAASGTVKLHHVESGGTADSSNVILPTTTLGVNEHGVDDAPFAMSTGDFIRAVGDNTNSITITIYGLEIS